jgi:hypothetical protein
VPDLSSGPKNGQTFLPEWQDACKPLSLKSKLEFLRRAIDYWRIYGFSEFLRLSLRYLRGQVPASEYPLDAELDLIKHERVNPRATAAAELFNKPSVAIIAELSLSQCLKYRVQQKLEVFGRMQVPCDYSSWNDGIRALGLLQFATVAIFYRVPDGEQFDAYIAECERLGVKTLYDIDDPIFSRQVYARNDNLDYLKVAEKKGLLDSSALFLTAMRRCEMLIGSTPQICDLMTRESGKAAYLWRNLIDSETLQAARQALSMPERASDALVIGYASGSRAHEADFRIIEPVLAEIMARHTNVELYILGYLELPPALKQYNARITRRKFTDSAGYMSDLAAVDINIVPLLNNEFNDCKSAIRFMEASLLGIPTIATAVGDFKHIVVHRETGLLAEQDTDWREYIELLLRDVDFRTQLGENARQMVLSKLSTMDEQYLGQLNVNVVEAIHGDA